jgi:hypothetical protein
MKTLSNNSYSSNLRYWDFTRLFVYWIQLFSVITVFPILYYIINSSISIMEFAEILYSLIQIFETYAFTLRQIINVIGIYRDLKNSLDLLNLNLETQIDYSKDEKPLQIGLGIIEF